MKHIVGFFSLKSINCILPFSWKNNFVLSLIHTHENESIILLFVQQKYVSTSKCVRGYPFQCQQISVNNYVVSKTHVLPPGRTPWVVPSILGYSRTHGLLRSIPGYSTYRGYFPSSQALAQLPITCSGRGSGTFSHMRDVTNRSNYTNMGAM